MIEITSAGQFFAHLPQPTHFSSSNRRPRRKRYGSRSAGTLRRSSRRPHILCRCWQFWEIVSYRGSFTKNILVIKILLIYCVIYHLSSVTMKQFRQRGRDWNGKHSAWISTQRPLGRTQTPDHQERGGTALKEKIYAAFAKNAKSMEGLRNNTVQYVPGTLKITKAIILSGGLRKAGGGYFAGISISERQS